MKATGIIRRVDDLGRIVLPKEVRRKVGITEGTPMEIFTDSDGIVLKKYNTSKELMNVVSVLSEAVDNSVDDLEGEKVSAIRGHIKEIRNVLK
ncbi:AbrB/MazE/SpoVT family DNA-binding domain-containing protein [Phocaeicola sartorii]|uniref:AbrB/MazE/SpoVT family DNA-binding domain-containing protein n=1 Tax=Phocaeicola sartorii TaxID=671267 RepID=UPI00272AA833|nr:AbrB/MazE/SpoVT family DNA-binding domain-containing protein [Phocaeicola sartorii]